LKIIRKYIVTSFLNPFATGLISFVMIMMITHFFDYMHTFLEHKPPVDLLASYFFYRIPGWAVSITPVAVLLAVLFSLGGLNRHHEITAIKSSGIKLSYVIRPLIAGSLVISILSGVISETIVPATNSRADTLFALIKKKDRRNRSRERTDFTYMGEHKRLYLIDRFKDNTIEGLKVIQFYPDSLKEQNMITAAKAVYQNGKWELYNGAMRKFSRNSGVILEYKEFSSRTMNFPESPANFSRPVKNPEQMDFLTLLRYIRNQEKGGFSTVKERVLLHFKISFPFSNTIILILGIPLALWGGMKNRTTGFFISIVICFIYWGALSVGRAMGTSGILSPALGAWSANILFLALSLLMMRYARVI